MKQLLRRFKQISVLILAIAFIGCEDDDVVLPKVVAGFTYTIDSDTRTVTFINTSENAQKHEWSLGDGTTSTLISPVKTYGVGSYTIVLKSKNVAGTSDTFEDTITFLDQDAPLITLLGDSTINVTIGDAFTDPGATALDEVDGDLTASIVVGGDTVDTNTEGIYTITYNVSDSQGNAAEQVERTVNVSAVACEDETEESLSPTDLNITFLTDPGTTAAQGSESGKFFQDNVTYEYANNPDPSTDANKSCKVGKVTKSNVQAWDNLQIDFDDKFTFTDGSNISLKVFSPVSGYKVTLKLEDKSSSGATTSGDRESTTSTTKTNEWEVLTIPFDAADSGIYDRLVVFFDLSTANNNTYYFDDLKVNLGSGGGGGGCVAETMQSINPSDFDLTFMSDPGTTAAQGSESNKFFQDNVTYEYVDNPDFAGANTSCKVGKVTKSNVQAWDNLQIDFDDKFTFTDGSNFTIKVFSPQSGYKVTLKLEDKGSSGATTSGDRESTTTTTKTNEWEELTIPFNAADSGIYDRLVIFFDLATASNNTYYFDDLKLNIGTGGGGGGTGGGTGGCTGTVVAATAFPVNFEGCESFIDTFKDSGSMTTELVANPASAGINTSDFVLKVTKASGTNRWGGFQNAFPSNFDPTKTIKVKIYSTKANVVMKFEINSNPQDSGSGNPGPQYATITNANTWTEVEITFTGIPGNNTGINQLVIKPDNPDGTDGETTNSEGIYYFDDIRLE
ncbi:MAG: immunoglobulin-like domain-containing protein [Algibacter sp.]